MRPILWMSEALSRALQDRVPAETRHPRSISELLELSNEPDTVVFLDGLGISELERFASEHATSVGEVAGSTRVIAICDGGPDVAIDWMVDHPWLSHVVSAALLERQLLERVVATVANEGKSPLLDLVRDTLKGRHVQLTLASQCAQRIDRMREYFAAQEVAPATVELLCKLANEILANAFYDAPAAAGLALPATLDVALPDDTACDLVYGCTDELAVVRVRDPFGAFARARMLGDRRWRILSVASVVAVSVVQHHHTDVLVGLGKNGAHPFAYHLVFKDSGKRRFWRLLDDGRTGQSTVTTLGETVADETLGLGEGS